VTLLDFWQKSTQKPIVLAWMPAASDIFMILM